MVLEYKAPSGGFREALTDIVRSNPLVNYQRELLQLVQEIGVNHSSLVLFFT